MRQYRLERRRWQKRHRRKLHNQIPGTKNTDKVNIKKDLQQHWLQNKTSLLQHFAEFHRLHASQQYFPNCSSIHPNAANAIRRYPNLSEMPDGDLTPLKMPIVCSPFLVCRPYTFQVENKVAQ